jgi:hypothetical protein
MRYCVIISLVCITGCNGDPGPHAEILETAPVSGTLTYQGKPLESYQVIFTPADGRRPAMGKTDSDGKFTLGTNAPGDGAVIGEHKVSVAFDPASDVDSAVAMPIDEVAQLPKPTIEIPVKYSNPETSGVSRNIPEGGMTALKIDLQ